MTKRTEIAKLGEFGLIRHLTEKIELKNESTIKGIGDDAAVLQYNNKEILVTTDLLLEGIHFDLTYAPLKHLGYKSAVVNFSDVYAMNGIPKQITVSIGISKRFSIEDLEELYAGIRLACEVYNVDLVGGDTSASLTGLTISITCLGEGEKERIAYRSGARNTDLICVSGDLGAAYMGLQLLEREKKNIQWGKRVYPRLYRKGIPAGTPAKARSPQRYCGGTGSSPYRPYGHDRYLRWPFFGTVAYLTRKQRRMPYL